MINLFDRVEVSEKNLEEILQFANFLKMNPIIEGCKKILEKKMDSSNCISTWKLAQSENLKNIAFEYARQNYEKVFFSIHLIFYFFNRD